MGDDWLGKRGNGVMHKWVLWKLVNAILGYWVVGGRKEMLITSIKEFGA
jgi:hypothetical protein